MIWVNLPYVSFLEKKKKNTMTPWKLPGSGSITIAATSNIKKLRVS